VDEFKCLTQSNIIHRDIKPDNILIHERIAKIADFGFAKTLELADLDYYLYL